MIQFSKHSDAAGHLISNILRATVLCILYIQSLQPHHFKLLPGAPTQYCSTQASEPSPGQPSAVHKIADRLDLVKRRALNVLDDKRKHVNAFDVERLSIREFDMREELFFYFFIFSKEELLLLLIKGVRDG